MIPVEQNTTGPGETAPERAVAFARLPRRTQIAGMRQLAGAALAAYDLPPGRLRLLVHAYNTTFRLDTEAGDRYVLRIHRSHDHTTANVDSELAWLVALRRDTALEVPAPVPTRGGSLLTVAGAPGGPPPHICVLFRWLPGRRVRGWLTPRRMERVGEIMAHLQNHAAGWQRPPGFVRARVDWPIAGARRLPDPLAPEVIAHSAALVAGTLPDDLVMLLTAALERVRAATQVLGQGPDTFGLIHGDLHYHNILVDGAAVRAIDFDDCGFGYRLWDFAVMLSEILDWPQYPTLRAALLAGYRRVRPLPAEHESHINAFIALRRVQDVLWGLEEPLYLARDAAWAAGAQASLAALPALLRQEPG